MALPGPACKPDSCGNRPPLPVAGRRARVRALLGCRLALGRWTWSKAVSPGASQSRGKGRKSQAMMRSILVGILVLMAAGVGWHHLPVVPDADGGAPYGAPFALVDQKGAPVTEAAFRAQPSAVFFGFTHCPEVCPTTLFELDGWLKQLGPKARPMQGLFRLGRPRARHPPVLERLCLECLGPDHRHYRQP